ncbi:hypothetical protein IAT38_004265 [Cryptococcus sp. DSM 104549]
MPKDLYLNRPYILFYGHSVTREYPIHLACLSQMYPAPFHDLEYTPDPFPTAEHYMMYRKAHLFERSAASRVLRARTPYEAKALGRKVRGFDAKKWDAVCEEVVERGNRLKFERNDELRGYLFATKGKALVEASPRDRLWGIGMDMKTAQGQESKWGKNKLGRILTKVRDRLIEEEDAMENCIPADDENTTPAKTQATSKA